MKKQTLFMETTEVPAERTAAEISSCLVQGGATQIAMEYDRGDITGLRWTMRVYGRDLLFAMPARIEPIYRVFLKRKNFNNLYKSDGSPYHEDIYVKARRVAWRQLLRWTQAQLAMIDCGMAESSEVFLPYLQTSSGQSLFEAFKGSEFKQLGPGAPQ